jgi:Lar family restriction alleviation protein
MNELKPCPFCGRTDELAKEKFLDLIGWIYRVRCKRCAIIIRESLADMDDAIHKWNTRPAENALQAEVERLKGELDGHKLVSKLAYADIRKLGNENNLLKKEIARIKMLIAYRRDVLLNMIKNHHEASLINEYNTMNILIEAINNPTKESEGEDE